MDELGLDYTLMFPTLASLVEERMKDDPDLIHDVIHALNEWMYETWPFNYEDRIFSTPVITLPIVDKAIEELEWCLERGAKTVLIRPAPVPGYRGTRSFGLPEFDPFWEACVEGRHPGVDARLGQRLRRVPQRLGARQTSILPFKPTRSGWSSMGKRPIEDTMAALVCHGALTRIPDLRILSIENGADWVPYLFKQLDERLHEDAAGVPGGSDRGVQAQRVRRPFWEDDFAKMAELCGVDRVLFGSDWPHPEGLAEPTKLIDDLQGLDDEGQRKVMGGNMIDLFKMPNEIVHKPDVPALVLACHDRTTLIPRFCFSPLRRSRSSRRKHR